MTALATRANRPPRHKPKEAATVGYLPSPPTDQEMRLYVRRHIYWLIPWSLLSIIGLTISQIRFALQAPWLYPFLLLTIALLIYYVISLIVNFGTKDFDFETHKRFIENWLKQPTVTGSYLVNTAVLRPERAEDGSLLNWNHHSPDEEVTRLEKRTPTIDVFMPVCGEPVKLLHNSWTYIKQLEWPGDKLRFFVLDDSRSSIIQALAEEFGFRYISRQNNKHQKAGNMHHAYWMTHTELQTGSGEYILVFDADFCPRPDMLKHLVPYMASDPKLAIVQSPQFFRILPRLQNWLERGAGAVQELFYRYIQQSRQQRDASICVGTNAVYRRAALAANGGPTQIGHSEDVHTGFDLRAIGWGLTYLPINLATGTCPSEISAFLAQQYRWCMGSMSLLGDQKFWVPSWYKGPVTWRVRLQQFAKTMRWRQRFSYFSGFFYYLMTAVLTIIGPLIPLILLTVHPELVKLDNYVFILPSVIYSLVIFPLWHHSRYGLAAFATRFIYGWAHLFALIDVLRGTAKEWSPTGGNERANKSTKTVLFAHFRLYATLISGGSAVAWVALSLWRMLTEPHWYDFAPMCMLGLLGLAIVAQALIPTWSQTFRSSRNKQVETEHTASVIQLYP